MKDIEYDIALYFISPYLAINTVLLCNGCFLAK